MSDQTGNVAAPDRDLATELVFAIRTGDVDAVRGLLSESPDLARRPLGGPVKTRTALHVVSDYYRRVNVRWITPLGELVASISNCCSRLSRSSHRRSPRPKTMGTIAMCM